MGSKSALSVKRLAIFWLICAAAGFAVAAGVAVLLCLAVDNGALLRRAGAIASAREGGRSQRESPRNALNAPFPDLGLRGS